jgi:hypothetical protein
MLNALVILAVLATAASLVLGMRSMTHGGEEDARNSGRLMGARVGLQGLTLVLLLLALFLGSQ